MPENTGDITKSTQIGNTAKKIAARDLNETHNYYNNFPATKLGLLFNKLREECIEDQTLQEFINDLRTFTRKVENEDVEGLENKLNAANRQDEKLKALELKQSIFQRLSKGKFSPTFQEIYGTLMAEVWNTFDLLIKPKIKSGTSRADIDALVYGEIIQPIMNKIENCGADNDITATTIRGMIYYLTGNCHIRWD